MKRETPPNHTSEFSWIPKNLSEAKVAIWGIGLMGGSLAMTLHGKTASLFGIDADGQVCHQAEDLGIFDRISTHPSDLLPLANVVILSAPLGILPTLLEELPELHPGSAVVMDIGSTKTNIMTMMEQLPDRFTPLGGHPMCGKEVRTLSRACTDLYQGASFALLPLPRTPLSAKRLALQLVEAVGSHPIWLDPLQHDRWVAAISHLPYLVANCLSGVTPLEAAPLVGPGFKSTNRLAGESIEMMIQILMNNRDNILSNLKNYHHRLELIEKNLECRDFEALRILFEEGAARRSAIMDSFEKGGNP
ncbi:MAG: prephenate dehydrogenase [Chloroflexi bacterium]|nr:prephenate dehydrogenase [Chloroflexota bacterium]